MRKDIPNLKVEGLAIAIVPRLENGQPNEPWDTYILNLKEESISSVIISSKGYGEIEGDKMRTTVLRHFFEEIPPGSCVKVEPIQSGLFTLTNEYWVSFVLDGYMYDKKYVFVKGSIAETNFTNIPLLNRRGVMIK